MERGIGTAALGALYKTSNRFSTLAMIIGRGSIGIEFLWQHMYRKTMAFGRKGLGMVAIAQWAHRFVDFFG